MAMRVVTLEKLGDYINDKVGEIPSWIRTDDSVNFICNDSVVCSIPKDMVTNLEDEHPFLKFRDQVKGVLSVDGSFVNEEELRPYSFLLD